MPQGNDPALGINSWLEDELYHQYQFDRKSVDEGWSQLFQGSLEQEPGQNGGTSPDSRSNGAPTAVAEMQAEPAVQEPTAAASARTGAAARVSAPATPAASLPASFRRRNHRNSQIQPRSARQAGERDRCNRPAGASARRSCAYRGKHDREPLHPGRHLPASDSRPCDRRESQPHQSASRAAGPRQAQLHPPDLLGDRDGSQVQSGSQSGLR